MTNQPLDSRNRPVVVVTGMGVLTSLGQGKKENWRKLVSGVSGIHRISRFPIAGLRTTIAGTVDFVPVDELSAPPITETVGAVLQNELDEGLAPRDAAEDALGESGSGNVTSRSSTRQEISWPLGGRCLDPQVACSRQASIPSRHQFGRE